MPEPADSAAVTAAKLLNDNRTAVCGKTATGYRVAVLPTLPNGLAFVAKTSAGADAAGTEVVADTAKAAHIGSADVARVVVPIDFASTLANGSSKYVRKQFFKSKVGDPSTGKWCYTNIKGEPLKADGTVSVTNGSYDVAGAADATTTVLTAVGQAVTNYVQPGPLPGTYEVSELQQGYSPYLGWTVKQVASPAGS